MSSWPASWRNAIERGHDRTLVDAVHRDASTVLPWVRTAARRPAGRPHRVEQRSRAPSCARRSAQARPIPPGAGDDASFPEACNVRGSYMPLNFGGFSRNAATAVGVISDWAVSAS